MSEAIEAPSPVESAPEATPEIDVTELTPEQYAKYKVQYKVSGQNKAASLDELVRQASLAEGARSKFDQAVSERKKAEELYRKAEENQGAYKEIVEILSAAKSDPKIFRAIVKELGSDHINDFITDYITERAQEAALTPEQRKLKEYESKLNQYQEAQKKEEQRQQDSILQERKKIVYNAIGNEFGDAISNAEGIPLSEIVELPDSSPKKQSVYLAMERALVIAQKQLRTEGAFDSLDTLYKRGQSQIRSMTSLGRLEAIENLSNGKEPIPESLAKALSKQQVELLRKSLPGRSKSYPSGTPSSSKVSKKTRTINDFFDR